MIKQMSLMIKLINFSTATVTKMALAGQDRSRNCLTAVTVTAVTVTAL